MRPRDLSVRLRHLSVRLRCLSICLCHPPCSLCDPLVRLCDPPIRLCDLPFTFAICPFTFAICRPSSLSFRSPSSTSSRRSFPLDADREDSVRHSKEPLFLSDGASQVDNGDNDALFYNLDERVDDEQDEGATSGQDEDIEDDADEEFVMSMMSGGRFTQEQILEVQGLTKSLMLGLQQRAKDWKRPLDSVMRIANLIIATKERQVGGNAWNAFQSKHPEDPQKETCPHHQYVAEVIKPAYQALIASHGGVESSKWKQEAQELVAEHKKLKSGFAKKVGLSPADIGSQLNSLKRRWTDDALSAAWMNIHVAAFLVSGHPDLAASKHNAVICGSPAMKQWIKVVFPPTSTLLPKIHLHILVAQGETGIHLTTAPKRLPPDMHGRRTACTAELTRIFEEQNDTAIGPKFPWSTIPAFLIRHRLYISGWPLKSEFPSVLGLIVSSLQTEHWTNLWNRLFAVEEHKCLVVKWLDIPASEDILDDTCLIRDNNNSTLSIADWHEYIGKQKSVASGNVGTSGEQAREAGKQQKRKEVPGGGSGKGKRRKVLSNPIIDEDESPEPLVGGESPEPLVGGESLEDHQVSAPPEPLQSNMFAKFAPGTLFDPSLTKYNFDFDKQIHFDMNGLNPNEGTNLLDFVNPAGPPANTLNLDFSQFPDLDMSENQDLLLCPML
ncbi:hypothetical protein BS47DRAFT_1390668 [Hydnum rufescens UP504]|uniref:Uncharacterized protein n=1 Tax=Hydnum rufescens UP504 TaxID=1448309 RepID=A0A9P6B2C2_9AGAM|nr:hypothetical protein BS47DRAFT_1390668 [Hydnum rufescens UP504]